MRRIPLRRYSRACTCPISTVGLIVHQMDVEIAFLNAKLNEEMHIKSPLGMEGL